ncbi:unnamed protein product [Clonostachys byssicola]|uniref:Pectate lyase superfamily protein domain-containing protein n=1 Tax=Clonostachys byssicola TaxID=160290 RepID=A0A9N9UTW7_9HYPO|nr:unnamed protein product [Clonostachys byssicola]
MLSVKFVAVLSWLSAARQLVLAADIDWESIKNSRGDKLPDFSYCGYRSSDKSLPGSTAASVVVKASSGDRTKEIQAALDSTAASGGGVVELAAGTFRISPGLNISANTRLRGSGVESTTLDVSKLKTAGLPLLSMGNGTNGRINPSFTSKITDKYVGIGARTVTVEDGKQFAKGQTVFISRAATEKWVRQNGMADLVRDGEKQTWVPIGNLIQQPRIVQAVSGNKLTLDIPLTDALDQTYMEPYVAAYDLPETNPEIGIEDLSITLSPTCAGRVYNESEPCNAPAIQLNPWTVDSFVRNVNITGFNNCIDVQYNVSRITIENASFFRDRDTDRPGGYPTDINISGTQVLVKDSGQYGRKTAKAFTVITQARAPGPNAVLRHHVQSDLQELYPHQRWAHGFLVENTNANVMFVNRGTAGSGQGWPINAGVAWNVRGGVNVSSPPLGINWAIGSTGPVESVSNGTLVSNGTAVTPKSLYNAQRQKRKGTA